MASKRRGFVLIAMSVTMLLLLAMMGLAFDVGRIYIARNEAQVFCGAAHSYAMEPRHGGVPQRDGGIRFQGSGQRDPGSRDGFGQQRGDHVSARRRRPEFLHGSG